MDDGGKWSRKISRTEVIEMRRMSEDGEWKGGWKDEERECEMGNVQQVPISAQRSTHPCPPIRPCMHTPFRASESHPTVVSSSPYTPPAHAFPLLIHSPRKYSFKVQVQTSNRALPLFLLVLARIEPTFVR